MAVLLERVKGSLAGLAIDNHGGAETLELELLLVCVNVVKE